MKRWKVQSVSAWSEDHGLLLAKYMLHNSMDKNGEENEATGAYLVINKGKVWLNIMLSI